MSRIRGGLKKNVDGSTILYIFFGLIVAHAILATLMWSGIIEFSSNDAKVTVATALTVILAFLLVYAMYISMSE